MDKIKDQKETVNTELSLHPLEENVKSDLWKEMINDELKELPPVKAGDVNLSSSYIFDQGDKIEVSMYIRNGLQNPINFENVMLSLLDKNGDSVIEQLFDLSRVGTIPGLSVRPFKIFFDKENLKKEVESFDDLKLVFNQNIKAVTYVDTELTNLPQDLDKNSTFALQSFVDSLPRLEKNQFSISTFYVKENDNGDLSVVLIFRNTTPEDVQITKLPVQIYDANNNLAAHGVFDNLNISVESMKAIVKEFVFLQNQRIQGEFDFTKWLVKYND